MLKLGGATPAAVIRASAEWRERETNLVVLSYSLSRVHEIGHLVMFPTGDFGNPNMIYGTKSHFGTLAVFLVQRGQICDRVRPEC